MNEKEDERQKKIVKTEAKERERKKEQEKKTVGDI